MNIANPKLMALRTFSEAMLWLSGFTAAVFATEDPRFPRTHPLEPDAAIRSFALQEGFSFQLAASEPLITDPVAAAFDEDGRLYVVEMNDYPYTDKSTDKPGVERTADLPIGKVRLLEDMDDDGVFDRSTFFARDLSWPTGIAVFRGGVFVSATPDVWYLKDEDGDGEAEVRRKIFSGFRKLNVQAVVNNLIWGLDHRIYGAGGTNGGNIVSGLDETIAAQTISRNDFCFDPGRPRMELLSGGARFGNTFDDWGNRFICNIRNPVQHVVLPLTYMQRNPALSAGSPLKDVAVAGDQIPVFRASPPEPWRVINAARLSSQGDPRIPRSEKNAQGFMTSASGVTVYRGDAYPTEFRQTILLAEVAGNLIHRQKVEPAGVTFSSQRIDVQSEFVTSTDNWFRPVNFVHAPDGTLFVLDMYRETIEHPWSMPDDLKALLDLENGRDRGRIYRLAPPQFLRRKTPRLSQATTEQLVELLQHANAWHRETAHRLLFERQDSQSIKSLRRVLHDGSSELGRLHALWSLHGINQLNDADLLAGFDDPTPSVREHSVRLAEERCSSAPSEELLSGILRLASDAAPRVRFQVALSLGQFADTRCGSALEAIATRDADDPWIVNAVLSSSGTLASRMLTRLLPDSEFLNTPSHLPLLRQLSIVTGVRNDSAELAAVGTGFQRLPVEMLHGATAAEVLLALNEGLKRSGSRLSVVWQHHAALAVLSVHISSARSILQNSQLASAERLNALQMLGCGDPEFVREAVTPLLTTQQPPEIQTAAVRTLATFQDASTASELLDVFAGSTPSVQYEIVEALANHTQRIPALLDAVADGRIAAAQITSIRRNLLINHANEEIRLRAQKLLAVDRETPRRQVLEQFRDAATIAGDVLRGKAIFGRDCSACHRVGDTGVEVGPSLVTVKHRSESELLTQILDPNREVGPGFMQFAVVLHDGQILTGMITEESPANLTLKRAENKQDIVQRESISEIHGTGLSLMPEGFEKKLTLQDLADLIAFLRAS